ncbi:MAG: Fic family protein [Candidatus Woesearchaeota archaeon]
MVYIYRKTIGEKTYYYLRASVRNKGKIIVKDIKYLGSDLNSLKDKLKDIPGKYAEEIRKTYKTLNRFIEVNRYLAQATQQVESDGFLDKEALQQVRACRIHWTDVFLKTDKLTQQEILKNFVIEYAFNTTSMEGNTISLEEAHDLLLENLTPKNKTLREIYDLQNTESVFFDLLGKQDINHNLICQIHDRLLDKIDSRKGYRTDDVRVFRAQFKATPAPYVKADMDLLLSWYKQNKAKMHPLALATIFHHKLEKIHPFMDGNGRTGRMLMNHILLRSKYPPVIIRKRNRSKYLDKLHEADRISLDRHAPEQYRPLVEFVAAELSDYYWNTFL